ncbi:uncharacterized protein LOC135492538 [Lineus longissimus]|uniref:uncharacterized protein LOC135492538 n=1 Tax=Lineus longissimus TaxID=88925 RepID=UPI00315CA974
MDERHSGGTLMDSDDWYIQQDKDVSVPTSKHRKKRFLGSHQNVESSSGHSSKSYATHNSSGGETTPGNKENRSDALNRLLARRKRNKLSSLYYSSDEDDDDEVPIPSRRLSSSLLQDSSGSDLDDSPGTEKSNESDVFGADDEFCMLSIEPKSHDQIKFNGRASGLLPGGGKEMFNSRNVKATEEQHFSHKEEFSQGFKNDKKCNSQRNGFPADWGNSDSELPDQSSSQNSHMNGIVKRMSSDLTDGNTFQKSPNHALPGNFYKKKFSHMFTSGEKKKPAPGRLSLLSSSSSSSDSESNSFLVNDATKRGPEIIIGNRLESPVFGLSSSITGNHNPLESKKRKYSAESFFFAKKRRSDVPGRDKSPREISPILKKSSPFQFDDSPRFPPRKENGQSLRRLSFEDEKATKTAAARRCSSDSDSDSFWKLSLPSKNKPKAKPTEKFHKSKPSTISASASRLSPPGTSRSRISDLKVCDPVRLSVSPKSRCHAPTSLDANQSLEDGMQFTDESLRKQLQDIFGNDSDEELEWQPTLKKTKVADLGKKSKKTKGSRCFVKNASGNTVGDYANVKTPPKVHKKKDKPESQEMFSDSEDDWEQKLQELVDDISSSSRRAKSGLALLTHGGKKGTSATLGQRSSVPPSFTRSSPNDHGSSTHTKPRNSSVSTFPAPNSSSRRYYDNRGLIHSEREELPKSVTVSSPPKLIQSVSSPKPKRRCRRAISKGSIIYIDDSESGSSDDDVLPITSNKHTMPLNGRVSRRDVGQVISPRIRELQEEDARNEYNTMLDPVLFRELEEELAPAKKKKTPKSRRGRGSLDDPVEMVVEVTLNEAIQREIQAGLRFRTSGSRGNCNTSTSATRRSANGNAIGDNAAAIRSTSGPASSLSRPVSHAASSPVSPGLFTFSAGPSYQTRIQNVPVSSPNSFYPSPPAVKSPRGRGKKTSKVTKRNPVTSPQSIANNPGFSPDVIPFVPTSPALQSSPRSKNTRSRQKTSRGSLNRPLDADPRMVVQQIDDDEAMARRMQEQMDMEFAQALMREEESAAAAAHIASQQAPSSPFPPPHMPANFLSPPQLQMPVPRAFNPPPTSQFNPCHAPQALVRKSPTTRGRQRQTRSHIADQVAINQIPNFDPHVDTAMYLHVAMGMGLVEPGRRPTISPPTRRGRGRGRQRRGIAAANAVQGDDYEALLALSDMIGEARPKGLNKTSIEQLPTKIFKKTASSSKDDECSVCMGEYEDGDNLRILPCFHNFHVKCIDKWIKDNATCPICRVPVKLS